MLEVIYMSTPGVKPYHGTLISLMKKLGYKSNERGVCFGYAHMGMQALLANDLKLFNERVELMCSINEGQLTDKIEDAKRKSVHLVQEAKLAGIPLKNFSIADKLTPEERALIDITAFSEGVELYQNTSLYKYLFDKKLESDQDTKAAVAIVASDSLKEKGNIANPLRFIGNYDQNELTQYFKSLKETILATSPPFTHPMSLILCSGNHAISVGFVDNQWVFIDANSIPTEYIRDDIIIAEKVLKALSRNEYITLETRVYVASENKNEAAHLLDSWQQDSRWQSLHKPSINKAERIDSVGNNLLDMAVMTNHPDTVDSILKLKFKSVVEESIKDSLGNPFSLFLIAVSCGYADVLKVFLKQELEPEILSAGFLMAAKEGHGNIMKILCSDKRFNVNELPEDSLEERTPLIMAIELEHDEVIKALLSDERVDPNRKSTFKTPLQSAAELGRLDYVNALLSHPKFKLDNSDLMQAARLSVYNHRRTHNDHFHTINVLMEKMGIKPDETCSNGFTAIELFYFSIFTNNDELQNQLLADPKKIPTISQEVINNSLCYHAAANGHTQFLKNFLTNHNVELDKITDNDNTLLIAAASNGDESMVRLLLAKGCDPNLSNGYETPLIAARLFPNVVGILLAHPRIDPNLVNQNGESALDVAAMFGTVDVVHTLLSHAGINPHLGYASPLHLAAKYGRLNIIQEMLKYKIIDPNLQDGAGKTAIDYALNSKHYDIAFYLLSDKRININKTIPKLTLNYNELKELYGLALKAKNKTMLSTLNMMKMVFDLKDFVESSMSKSKENIPPSLTVLDSIVKHLSKQNLPINFAQAVYDSYTEYAKAGQSFDFLDGLQKQHLILKKLSKYYSDYVDLANLINGVTSLHRMEQEKEIAQSQLRHADATIVNRKDKSDKADKADLIHAVTSKKNSTEEIRVLLAREDLNPNLVSIESGLTALHYAIELNRPEVVKAILSRDDIDLSIKDRDGKTVMNYAEENYNPEITSLLENYELFGPVLAEIDMMISDFDECIEEKPKKVLPLQTPENRQKILAAFNVHKSDSNKHEQLSKEKPISTDIAAKDKPKR